MIDFSIGKPYSFREFNCWDYVSSIRLENGIKTKLFRPKNLTEAFGLISSGMKSIDSGLLAVNSPENFDIIIVKEKKIYHCGLYYDGLIIHCSRQLKQVVCESLTDFKKHYSEYSFWR